jgi:hypothetical protein
VRVQGTSHQQQQQLTLEPALGAAVAERQTAQGGRCALW